MSREIKFRQWSKPEIIKGTKIGGKFNYWGYVDGRWKMPLADRDNQQFTGLKDKNGVEIYEGDIVGADDLICKVVWNGVGWKAEWQDNRQGRDNSPRYPDLDFRKLEIIGNIYENPELLK